MKKPIFNIKANFAKSDVKSSSLPIDPVAKALAVQQRINNAASQLQNLTTWCGTITTRLETRNNNVSQLDTTRQQAVAIWNTREQQLLAIENLIAKQNEKNQNRMIRKQKLEQDKIKASTSNNPVKLAAINSAIDNLNLEMTRVTDIAIPGLESRAANLRVRASKSKTKVSRLDTALTQAATKSADTLKELNAVIIKTLASTETLDKLQNKLRVVNTKINSENCMCPAVYQPVNMRGVVYENECIARCKLGIGNEPEPLLPLPSNKPLLPNGNERICLQVITCGSDGQTYSSSCLPPGVFPSAYGRSCADLGYDPVTNYRTPNVWSSSFSTATSLKSGWNTISYPDFSDPTYRIASNYIPQDMEFCCGTDDHTYRVFGYNGPISNQWPFHDVVTLPTGIGIKHLGPCNYASKYEIGSVTGVRDDNGGVRLSVNFIGSLANSFPNKGPNDGIYATLLVRPLNQITSWPSGKGLGPVAVNWLNPTNPNAPAGINLGTELMRNSLTYNSKSGIDNIQLSTTTITHLNCWYNDCIDRSIVPLRRGVPHQVELFVWRGTGNNADIDRGLLSYSSEKSITIY